MKKLINFLRVVILLCLFVLSLKEASKTYLDELETMEMLEVSNILETPLNGYYEAIEEENYYVTGAYKQGILDGDVLIEDKNNIFSFKGFLQDGIYAGLGKVELNGNLIYKGRFKNGKYNGYGEEYKYDNDNKLVWKYTGQFEKGKKNGYGIIETNQESITGIFNNDIIEGKYYHTNDPLVPNLNSLMMQSNIKLESNIQNNKSNIFTNLKNISTKIIKNSNLILDKFKNIIINFEENKISKSDTINIRKLSKNGSKDTKNNKNSESEINKEKYEEMNIETLNIVSKNTKLKRNEIAKMVKNKIELKGDESGNLMKNAELTYQEATVVLDRFINSQIGEYKQIIKDIVLHDTKEYKNYESKSYVINSADWAKDSIINLIKIGVLNYGDKIDFSGEISREEFEILLDKCMKYIDQCVNENTSKIS